ncbi:NTP transferase domain-containing protein [Aquabacterium sp.]|uniref:nucleotidyltransferase family protein n=1 Tax=Aquabacterium sp. TaxID=1872578 RepID=UPI00199A3B45|nr:NTP transferase domain-containing protein [Aquabacterium sp.]MBC7701518.1 NTP transferase domain-containing protein [Aquabacterium sp.]
MSPPAVPMAATILAAGLGRRLGHRPKSALQMGGTSLLERLIGALRGAGLEHVSVVIGPYAETLLPIAHRCGAHTLQHGQPDTSLIDSQRRALQAHRDQSDGHDLLIVLADLPWLNHKHLHPLLEAWQQRAAPIHAQMPIVDGVRGHPLILTCQAAQQVLATPAHLGIRDWLARHPDFVQPIPTGQPAHVTDLDTPSDLAALQAHWHPVPVSWPAPWADQ